MNSLCVDDRKRYQKKKKQAKKQINQNDLLLMNPNQKEKKNRKQTKFYTLIPTKNLTKPKSYYELLDNLDKLVVNQNTNTLNTHITLEMYKTNDYY